jgi:hypothetical protein
MGTGYGKELIRRDDKTWHISLMKHWKRKKGKEKKEI